MRKIFPATAQSTSFSIFVCTLCLVVIFFVSCASQKKNSGDKYKSWRDYIQKDEKNKNVPPDTAQLVVWRTPKPDDTYLDFWLDSITRHCGTIHISFLCETCDSSLLLLTGPGVLTYIQSGGKGGGSGCTTNCPPHGGGDTIYWGVNLPLGIYDPVDSLPSDYKPPVVTKNDAYSDTAVTVAVFDTGVDPRELDKFLYHNNVLSCLGLGANNGWNFAGTPPNADCTDDYISATGHKKHGAIVARLIVDQVNHYLKNQVKILPIKIHDANGVSSLFNVLCGLAYAKERGAKIINASFGYYAAKVPGTSFQTDPTTLLMKEYIKYYLTNNDILLVAAAGNKNDALENAAFTSAGLPLPADPRSLDDVYFYPASFAADPDLPNVIAVTTVHMGSQTVSPLQNHSSNVVDAGVNADRIDRDFYYFKNPSEQMRFVEGSSFATPIVTGIICAHYDLIKNHLSTSSFSGQNILEFLLDPEQNLHLGHHVQGLVTKIKGGKVFIQNVH